MRIAHVTFATCDRMDFVVNWATHLAALRATMHVGLMTDDVVRWRRDRRRLRALHARSLRVFRAPPPSSLNAQAGRWSPVLAFLEQTIDAAHVIVSDVDVVWTRRPDHWWTTTLRVHPRMDMALSTDAIFERTRAQTQGLPTLDPPHACWASLNIGIFVMVRGRRAGLDALALAVRALTDRETDQTSMNRAWKRGGVGLGDDGLCLLRNGTIRVGMLPVHRFCNSLVHAIGACHDPIATHATWMRSQASAVKRWRLAELGLWIEPPAPATMSYTPIAPPVQEIVTLDKDGVPRAHIEHMRSVSRQLARALIVAKATNRTLILPYVRCACETGLWVGHVTRSCRAHASIRLPMDDCPIDAILDPVHFENLVGRERVRSRAFLPAIDHLHTTVSASQTTHGPIESTPLPWTTSWCCATVPDARVQLTYNSVPNLPRPIHTP